MSTPSLNFKNFTIEKHVEKSRKDGKVVLKNGWLLKGDNQRVLFSEKIEDCKLKRDILLGKEEEKPKAKPGPKPKPKFEEA